jgi:hypothetical protein
MVLDVWCSEIAGLVGMNVHCNPSRVAAGLIRRHCGARTHPPHRPHQHSSDPDSHHPCNVGVQTEMGVYMDICKRAHPPSTQTFAKVILPGVRLVGRVDGWLPDYPDAVLEIKTRMSDTNMCFDHEYVQIQSYLACTGMDRCLFVQHVFHTNTRYALWVHRDESFWGMVEQRLACAMCGAQYTIYVLGVVCVLYRHHGSPYTT